MVEAVISVVVEKVTGCLLDPVGRQFGYLFSYRRNISDLNQLFHSLQSARERVQIAVDEASRRGDEIHSDVQDWLKYAQGIVQTTDAFNEAEKIASKSCFYFKSRYRLSKQAKRDAEEVAAKISEASNFMDGPSEGQARVSYRPPPPTSVVPFIASSSFKDYEAFESRESTFNQIMEALRNEDLKRVGVWGMGGVGKTTLVKQVAKQVEEEQLFHKVIVVLNITEKPDIADIQERIARMVGVTFEKAEDRAVRLRQCLKKQGKSLVILDDLWEKLEMGEIGIPHGDDDDHKGCKLLLTSRERRVLDTDMNTQMEFHLRHLNEEEAWSLFKKTVGNDHYGESPNLQRVALDIVKKCEGLPVAIVTIANALKKETAPAVWENALEELRRSEPINVRGVSKNVYSCLELSYNHLEGDEVKSLFLLCGLVGIGNISMDRLLQYAMGLNLFKGFYSCDRAANKLIALVEKLKVSSLLLDINEDGDSGMNCRSLFFDETVVRMHDVVRDVARSIASRDPHRFVVKEGVELREWQRTDEVRTCSRISLRCRNMIKLAQGLVCPQLDFFSLNSSNDNHRRYLEIPDGFFQNTKQLRVLDLYRVSLAPSCSSLRFLSNLQTLCLRYCQIKEIAAIGEMKRLQILSLIGSDMIERLPEEMKQLSDLRVLDLWNCRNLKVIPRNVISSLSQLEYLSMRQCLRMQWDPEGLVIKGINACFSELKHLLKLRGLEVQVSDVSRLPKDDDAVVVFNNLSLMSRYNIEIGPPSSLRRMMPVGVCKASRRLVLNEVKSPEIVKCFSKLLKRSQFVHLEKLCDNYYDDFGFGEELKYLSMKECHGIHSIPGNALVKLEVLELHFLNNLEAVCQEPPKEYSSFANLRKVGLRNCKRLKYVFTFPPASTGTVLLNEETAELDFPELQSLSLVRLKDITNFFCPTGCGHEDTVIFFNHKATFPALESLQLCSLDKVGALWHNYQLVAARSFSKLKTLELGNCKNLLKIFPLSLAKALVQLEELSIANCQVLEAIVVANEDEDEVLLFPKLTSLRLEHLPQLKTFCSGNSRLVVRCPLLKTLQVEYCHKVEILFQGIGQLEEGTGDHGHQQPLFFLNKDSFSSLESLNIEVLDSLKALWQNQLLLVDSFSKLKELKIGLCNKLLNLFPSNILLKGLQSLEIWYCDGLEKIFDLKRINGKETIVLEDIAATDDDQFGNNFSFNKDDLQNLQSLKAYNCPRLEYVFPVCVAKTLMQLQDLQINCCKGVKTIIFNEDEALIMPSFSFPKLTSLTLCGLPQLEKFWSGRFPLLKELDCDKMEILSQEICLKDDHYIGDQIQPSLFLVDKVAFPSLESLGLYSLPNVRDLWHSQILENSISFSKLKTFKLDYCDKMLNVFPLCVAKALLQLEDFCIKQCEVVEAIVVANAKDDEDHEDPCCNLFPKLTSLSLDTLPQLKTFCSGRLTLRWPLLKKLEVSNCDKVEVLFQGQLEGDELDDDHWIQQPFFLVDKVSFPSLELLNIQRLDSVKALWHNQLLVDSFPELKELKIGLCNGLLNPFESKIHKGLPLTVEDCDSVKENIIQFEKLLPSAQVQLDVETVLPQHLDVQFWNLQTLEVTECGSLINLLTSSTAKRVANQLKEIVIRECQMMNGVVGNDQKGAPLAAAADDDDEIEFTRLESLSLFGLPNLKSFCSERYIFRFPSLERIIVGKCPKLERFCNGVPADAYRGYVVFAEA